MDPLSGAPQQIQFDLGQLAQPGAWAGDRGFFGRQPQPAFTGDQGFEQPVTQEQQAIDPGFHGRGGMSAPTPPIIQPPARPAPTALPEEAEQMGIPGQAPFLRKLAETWQRAYDDALSRKAPSRATELLKSAIEPSATTQLGDIARALGMATPMVMRPSPSYGEAMNQVRAGRIKEAEAQARVAVQEDELQARRDEFALKAGDQLLKMRGEVSNAYKTWLEAFKDTVDPDTFRRIAIRGSEALSSQPVTTAEDAYRVLAQSISEEPLVPRNRQSTADERFLTEYVELDKLRRSGIPLTPEQQARMDFITSFRFTKVTPTATGVQVTQPNFTGAAPAAPTAAPAPGAGAQTVVPPVPGGPKITRTEVEQKALPKDTRDELTAGLRSLGYIDAMERATDQRTGRLGRGLVEMGKMYVGKGAPEFVDAVTARDFFRVDAQALIKGIPSNFDVQTFFETLWSPYAPPDVNRARLTLARNNIQILTALNIAYHKGLGVKIPEEVYEGLRAHGIDPEQIKPLTAAEVRAKTQEMKERTIPQTAEATREVNGVTYYKFGNKWLKLK